MATPRFGELYYCSSLTLLPGCACRIHAFSQALYYQLNQRMFREKPDGVRNYGEVAFSRLPLSCQYRTN